MRATPLLLLLLLASFLVAMEHHKFEKCDQKGFCKRLRQQTNNEEDAKQLASHYTLIESSIKTNKDAFSAVLRSKQSETLKKNIFHDDLFLTVNALERGMFRLRVKEQKEDVADVDQFWQHEPAKRRQAKDVLLDDHVKPVAFISKTADGVTRIKQENGNSELHIVHGNEQKAFQVILVSNGQESVIFNSRSLLTVESIYKKESPPTIQDGNNTLSYEGESAVGIDFAFPGSQHVYGIPERATDLSLKPTRGAGVNSEPYRMYNLDIFRYELENPIGLYGVIPLLYAVNPKVTTAVFVLNPSETFVDISKDESETKAHWISETGIIDVFFIPGPTPKDAIQQYAYLTGTSPLPQLFSLAYHQCRWNYKDEEDVRNVDAKFDEHAIPYDVLWLDIEHTDDKKYFTWDSHLFPNPLQMLKNLDRKGRKMVTISDPHIKRSPGYFVHDEATTKGYYVKSSSGGDYEGHCWPGSSSWLDFFNPQVRNWYASLFSFDVYKGSAENLYTWIDMNEPSVFSGPEITMHKDAKHFGDVEHREVHNQYGFYHGMATNAGHIQRRNGQDRPFILTRSFFAGSQRYIAVWTGDNEAKWEHLDKGQPMSLAMSISGIAYIGADVGGFFDNPEPELLVRWYQAGAFLPFFRAHAHIETQRREPWLFGDENTALIRSAVIRRYKLLPFYYTLAYHTALTGLPLIRPLFVEYPTDTETYGIQNQILVGEDLLVRPVVTKGATSVDVYFPGDQPWYGWEDGVKVYSGSNKRATVYTPLDYVPVFQRGGSIIPMKTRVRRSSFQMAEDPYTLQIALNNNGKAAGDLYVDDGRSFNYKQGAYVLRSFTFDNNVLKCSQGNVTLNPVKPNNHFTIPNTVERIVIFGVPQAPKKVVVSPVAQSDSVQIQQVLEFEFNDKVQKLTIRKPDLPVARDWTITIQ